MGLRQSNFLQGESQRSAFPHCVQRDGGKGLVTATVKQICVMVDEG